MKKLLGFGIFLFLCLIFSTKVNAAGTFYFSPSSGNLTNGQDFTVSVRVSGMDGSDVVRANFTYPTDKFTFVSIDSTASAWSLAVTESENSGTVDIVRGSFTPVTGDQLVGNITFKPKVETGTASLTFTSLTAIVRSGSNVTTGKTNASYTIGQVQTQNQTQTLPNPSSLTISEIKVSSLTTNSAVITWKTNLKATSRVEYGLGVNNYQYNSFQTDLTSAHQITLDSKILVPGLTYYFVVKSTDSLGNLAVSPEEKFTTLVGYDLVIKLVGVDGKPLANTKVTLFSEPVTKTTDSKGAVTFNNVTPGEHVLVIETKNGKISKAITVKNSAAESIVIKDPTGSATVKFQPVPQVVSINLGELENRPTILFLSVIVLGLLLILLVLVAKRKKPTEVTKKTPITEPFSA